MDLVGRHFRASGPLELWVVHLVQVPTQAVPGGDPGRVASGGGGLGDASRCPSGAGGDGAVEAPACPRPGAPLRPGAQETSLRLGARLRAAGILPSMGRKGDAYDNALCEAFFATLNREVLRRCPFRTREEARSVLLRLPGRVLQPEATAFCSGVPIPEGAREEVVSGSRICQRYPLHKSGVSPSPETPQAGKPGKAAGGLGPQPEQEPVLGL